MSDPRVFFAAERTLLAWVRTGITIVALGFVVARFGLFLSAISLMPTAAEHLRTHRLSAAIGVLFVLLGSGAILAALYNHRCYVRLLPREDFPRLPLPWMTTVLALAVAACGLVLAAYLAVT